MEHKYWLLTYQFEIGHSIHGTDYDYDMGTWKGMIVDWVLMINSFI